LVTHCSFSMGLFKLTWLFSILLFQTQLKVLAHEPAPVVGGGVKLTSDKEHVTIDNGIMQLVLSNPTGQISEIKYHGSENLLETHEPEQYGGYFDVAFQPLPSKEGKTEIVEGTKYVVIKEKDDIVEVSFTRQWSKGAPSYQVPLNVDKRFIVRKGDCGFYAYVIVERLKGFPDVDMNLHRYAFKPNKTMFNYMAISDDIQLVMPTEADRQAGKPLAYKEAVLLTNPVSNPAFKDQVDDKYEYTLEKTNLKLKEADDKGNFEIKNVRPGDYNLFGYVPGVVGTFRHPQLITIKPGYDIKLGLVTFKPPRNGPTVWDIGIPDRSANEFFVPDVDPKYVNKFWLDKPKDK
ncbi:hypothetical protein LINPERPRIM_LOCUS19099, partial [Linum perenne]